MISSALLPCETILLLENGREPHSKEIVQYFSDSGMEGWIFISLSGVKLFARARYPLPIAQPKVMINKLEAMTRDELAHALQPALALGFYEAVGRATRGAFHFIQATTSGMPAQAA